WGIDAPESTQLCRGENSLQYRCGAKESKRSRRLHRAWACQLHPHLTSHTLATCTVDGTDLGQWLVRNGLALDWPNYSHGMYDKIQREAEHAGRGMWSGSYVAPWLYRTCIRAGGRPADLTRMLTHDCCVSCWAAWASPLV